MDYSELYFEKTGENYFYNIMPVNNLPSVFKYGILSKNRQKALGILAKSVADNDVQERRDRVTVPNGLPLHSYANLYFTYWNPMLSRIREHNNEICILRINTDILNFKDVVITDMNASKDYVRFYDVFNGLNQLDYETIFMEYWNDYADYFKYDYRKGVKCAEILIPKNVPPEYISDIIVVNENVRLQVANIVPENINIVVNPNYFF